MSLLARASVQCGLGGNISIFVLLVIQKEVLLISLHLGNIYCSDFFLSVYNLYQVNHYLCRNYLFIEKSLTYTGNNVVDKAIYFSIIYISSITESGTNILCY